MTVRILAPESSYTIRAQDGRNDGLNGKRPTCIVNMRSSDTLSGESSQGRIEMDSPKEFLAFRDWLESSEHRRNDWIVVARLDKSDVQDNRGTFSALLHNNEQDANNILRTCDWDIGTDLGHPFFATSESSGKITFDLGSESSNDVALEAFTIRRYFHTAFDSKIEIVHKLHSIS